VSAFTTSIIEPSALTPAERAAFTDELFASHQRIFTGIDRAEFAAYVVDSPAALTRIHVLRDLEGTIRGYTAFHRFHRERAGAPTLIVRLESGYESEYRRRNVQGPFLIAEVLKLCLGFPRLPKYILGSFVHPSAYVALRRHTREIWPRQDRETPSDVRTFMSELARDFSLEPVDERPGVYRVGWVTRESRREGRVWRQRIDADASYFVEQNPEYRTGQGLLTLIPLHLRALILGAGIFLRRNLGRSQPVPAPRSVQSA